MTLTDFFAYYLGANYEYNEELKRLFESSSLYDFCSSERNLIGFTPSNFKVYLKVVYFNKTKSYLELETLKGESYSFDGVNILVRNKESIKQAQELVRRQSTIPLCRRISNRIVINDGDMSYDACMVNLTNEQLCLYIYFKGTFWYIKYDYETNSFSANFDIDWYRMSETTINDIYIPDVVSRYINSNGKKHEFSMSEHNIDVLTNDVREEAKKYFIRLR